MNYTLSEIYIYPIKSLGGIRVTESTIEKRGLQYDRRWMLVDETGCFMSQRKYAQMALLQVSLLEDGIQVTHKTKAIEPLLIPFEANDEKSLLVTIWEDVCFAFQVTPEANAWFLEVLGMNCKLVYMPDNAIRNVDPEYGRKEDIVSFADAYPFLIIGQESLNDLNSRLANPVPMDRFRPNFVFTGGKAFDEDTWTEFKIGETTFYPVKPCAHCILTTINQETGEKSDEPLKTLATYRTRNNKVMFGMNLIHNGAGNVIKVGQEIEVVD
ncbi:MOSC domain-containing protein [Adhaeribacter soli]|uniref:MOSC domain-containing protein n=1 Tax=Adhaeribacter soli TaxID=2607655 RepID=A0A5N1J2I9_9BACT|nr:MOSC N-terminal beta barrel domain-containing protein [Adhaeribacter soli]KAA9340742.1 MOSC domain-containing protein [Adhaeribacter soli]